MTTAGEDGAPACGGLGQPRVDDGAERCLGILPEHGVVERPQHGARALLTHGRRPDRMPCQARDRRRIHAFATDVADHDRPIPLLRLEEVVEVTADLEALAGRLVSRGNLDAWNHR